MIVNQYIVERYRFAYDYRKPVLMSHKLNSSALEILSVAPLLLCTFGWWQLGNHGILKNDIKNKINLNEVLDPDHDISNSPSHSLPLLIVIPIFVFFNQRILLLKTIYNAAGCFTKLKFVDNKWNI